MLWIIFPPIPLNGTLPYDLLFIVVVSRVLWAAAALENGGAMQVSLIKVGETGGHQIDGAGEHIQASSQ